MLVLRWAGAGADLELE